MNDCSTWNCGSQKAMWKVTSSLSLLLLSLGTLVLASTGLSNMNLSFTPPTSLEGSDHMPTSFSVDLMHAQHVDSPYALPDLTLSQRGELLVNSSRERWQHLAYQFSALHTPFGLEQQFSSTLGLLGKSIYGAYVMKFQIGTPGMAYYSVMDTANDLVWLKCFPCQGYTEFDPAVYKPLRSSTFHFLKCSDDFCRSVNKVRWRCDQIADRCRYRYFYAGELLGAGAFASETITFYNGRTKIEHRIGFGCTNNTNTRFKKTGGYMGMSRAASSLVMQLRIRLFSYCLLEPLYTHRRTSELLFGSTPPGMNFAYTTLYQSHVFPRYYAIQLNAIHIDGLPVRYDNVNYPGFGYQQGNSVMDSGAAVTMLVEEIYVPFREAIVRNASIPYDRVQHGPGLDVCYDIKHPLVVFPRFPSILFLFEGMNLTVPKENAFVQSNSTVYCLAFERAPNRYAFHGRIFPYNLLGSYLLKNNQISYDLDNNRIGFHPHPC